jgi:spore germination cell wall hydrolase CwlJ-like protein
VKNVDGYVGALSVNLRNGPGTDYDVIGEYECNTLLLITAKTDEWYQVEIEDKTGFMLKEFIGVGAIPMPTPEPTKKPASKTTPKPTSKPEPTATPKPAEATNGGVGSYSASEVLLTAQIVYKESRQGDYDGYRAVANVILNRVQSGIFRSTIEGVIFQGNGAQFGPADDEAALRAVKPSSTCIEAVQAVLGGDTILPSNVYYFRPASKGESWSSHKYEATYGGNAFFS